ncbi:hypothetical protein FRB93_011195 [Tulasnella sp. JGI-2019a]|nr:hypothetical protein FRB93_011195 [Tulasnella sp. JGI-2019a]
MLGIAINQIEASASNEEIHEGVHAADVSSPLTQPKRPEKDDGGCSFSGDETRVSFTSSSVVLMNTLTLLCGKKQPSDESIYLLAIGDHAGTPGEQVPDRSAIEEHISLVRRSSTRLWQTPEAFSGTWRVMESDLIRFAYCGS